MFSRVTSHGSRRWASFVFRVSLFVALFALPAAAQYTLVTGVVKDANGLAYAGGQLKAQLILAGGGSATGLATVTITNQQQCISAGQGNQPCHVSIQGTLGPFTLDGAGNLPGGGVELADNALVQPAGTQWLLTVNETPGVSPPLGTGPQLCSAQLTITGATQSVSGSFAACPGLSNIVPGGVSPAGAVGDFQDKLNATTLGAAHLNDNGTTITGTEPIVLPNASTATTQPASDNTTKVATDAFVLANNGVVQAAALPGTCTVTSNPVQLTISPYGIYYPVISNGVCVWAGGITPGSNIFNVHSYGAYGDTQDYTGTTFTWLTQNSIICAACNFTAADVGKTIYNAAGGSASPQQYGVIGHVTAGVVDSVTGYNGFWQYPGNHLVWGHIDDAAGVAISPLINAILVNGTVGTPSRNTTIYFPSGGYMLCGTPAAPSFLTVSAPNGGTVTMQGDGVYGGYFTTTANTIIYPCPNPPTPTAAFGALMAYGPNALYMNYENLSFNGAYVGFNVKYYGIFSYASYVNNVNCTNLQYNTSQPATMSCISLSTGAQVNNFIGDANGPGAPVSALGGNIEIHMSRTANNYGAGVSLRNVTGASGSAGFRWIGGQIDESACNNFNGNVNVVNSYSVWFVDTAIFTCPGAAGVYVDPTSVVHLNGDEIGPFSGGAAGLYNATGGKVIAADTRFYAYAGSPGYCINNLGTFINLGGNRCEESDSATATEAGNVVTLTTAHNHRLTVANIGDYINVSSMAPAGYNCPTGATPDAWNFCWQITGVPTGTQIQYTDPTGSLGAGTGGYATVNTWNGGAFNGNIPLTDSTPTWNTCYDTIAVFAAGVLCSQPTDRALYLSRVRATSTTSTTCATPPVITLTNGNVTTTLTLTSGQTVWDTFATPSTFPIASGSLPQYYAPTLPDGSNSPTVSTTAGTCATPPTNFSITSFGTSPGTP